MSMSHFDSTEELDNIENLQQQTRDPFQLELLDAVKRRQQKETGFEDGRINTQRHSKELDIKMSKYLGNKQSPFRNQLEESPFDGDFSQTMSLGTSNVNNKRTTHLDNSKWGPSISIDKEDFVKDGLSNDSDEDGLVIGHNIKCSAKADGQSRDEPHTSKNTEAIAGNVTSNGLKPRRVSGKGTEIVFSKNKETLAGSGPQVLLKGKTDAGKAQIKDTVEKREMSTKRDKSQALNEGKNLDDKLKRLPKSDYAEQSPRTRSEIEDIFGQGRRKQPDYMQEDNDLRLNPHKKNFALNHDDMVENVGSRKEPGGFRSRSGSRKEESAGYASFETQRSRSSSGKTTPPGELEVTRERIPTSRSDRASPLDALLTGSTRKPCLDDQEVVEASSALIGDRPRSRANSGKLNSADGAISTSKRLSKVQQRETLYTDSTDESRHTDTRDKTSLEATLGEVVPRKASRSSQRKTSMTAKESEGHSSVRPGSAKHAENEGLRKRESQKFLPGKKHVVIDSDSDSDDDFIGIKTSGNGGKSPEPNLEPQSLTAFKRPGIRQTLVPDTSKTTPLPGKRLNESRERRDRVARDGFTDNEEQLSTSNGQKYKESLKRFKVKGKLDGDSRKASPMKASAHVKGSASVPSKELKGGSETSSTERQRRATVKTTAKRSLSFTNISNINPKTPYQDGEDGDYVKKDHFSDSSSLREQIYYDWLKEKSSRSKVEIAEMKRREKEKEKDVEQEKKDKIMMSQKAFEAWKTSKEETLQAKHSSLKEQNLKGKEKLNETQQKKLDAKKYFESWKTQKDQELIEKHRKRKEEEREKRKKELEEKDEKLDTSKKVYENWKAKKDRFLKEQAKEKKEKEREEKLKSIEEREKKKAAEKMFETWKEKKIKSPREDIKLVQRAWCPVSRNTGNAIPTEVNPVIQRNPPNRTRTLSASARLQSATMGSTFKRM